MWREGGAGAEVEQVWTAASGGARQRRYRKRGQVPTDSNCGQVLGRVISHYLLVNGGPGVQRKPTSKAEASGKPWRVHINLSGPLSNLKSLLLPAAVAVLNREPEGN